MLKFGSLLTASWSHSGTVHREEPRQKDVKRVLLSECPDVLTWSALLSCMAHPPLASDGVSQPGQLSRGVLGAQLQQTLGLSRLVWAVLGPAHF